MIPISYRAVGIFFIVSLVGVVGANMYFLQSPSSVKMPSPAETALPVDGAGQHAGALISNNLIRIISTEQAIMKQTLSEKDQMREKVSSGQENPFLWPEERQAQELKSLDEAVALQEKAAEEVEAQKEEIKVLLPELKMIIIGERIKMSLLDDTFVHEGDNYNDFFVKEITEEEVVLVGETGEKRLSLVGELFDSWVEEQVVPSNSGGQFPEMSNQAETRLKGAGVPIDQNQVEMMQNLIKTLQPFLQEEGK